MITVTSSLARATPPWARLAPVIRALVLSVAFLGATMASAASDAEDAVKKADTERINSTLAHDRTRLGAVLSDSLSYCQYEGNAMTKDRFLTSVAASQNKYDSYVYEDVNFSEVVPGVVTMTGKARVKGVAGGKPVDFSFRVLSVWRTEGGTWRLYAYQSARQPGLTAP